MGCGNPNCESKQKELKKCGRCLCIEYCSVECQTVHYKIHKGKCRSSSERVSCREVSCRVLESVGQKFQVCMHCRMAYYCSSVCQLKDWAKHEAICKPPLKGSLSARDWLTIVANFKTPLMSTFQKAASFLNKLHKLHKRATSRDAKSNASSLSNGSSDGWDKNWNSVPLVKLTIDKPTTCNASISYDSLQFLRGVYKPTSLKQLVEKCVQMKGFALYVTCGDFTQLGAVTTESTCVTDASLPPNTNPLNLLGAIIKSDAKSPSDL